MSDYDNFLVPRFTFDGAIYVPSGENISSTSGSNGHTEFLRLYIPESATGGRFGAVLISNEFRRVEQIHRIQQLNAWVEGPVLGQVLINFQDLIKRFTGSRKAHISRVYAHGIDNFGVVPEIENSGRARLLLGCFCSF